jgi:hypothetical protein
VIRLVVVLLAVTVGAAYPTARAAQPHDASDRITVVSLIFGDRYLGTGITEEHRRLEALCYSGDQLRSATCLSANLRVVRERLSPLFGAPRAGAPVGYLMLRPVVSGDGVEQLGLGLDIEWADRPGIYHQWIADVGDWGYGYHIDGWGVPQGEWVRLLGPPPLRAVWVPMVGDGFWVDAVRMERNVVHLRALRARPANGGRLRTLSGQYTIVETRDGHVVFREEIPADMPCGDDVADPSPLPTIWTAPASALFDRDGTPRFSTVYTKGC